MQRLRAKPRAATLSRAAWHYGWAYLTGAGNLAAALGILFAIWPRLAATAEAAMLSVITLLVWLPALIGHPADTGTWSAFLMSTAIASGAWLAADSYRAVGWRTIGVRNDGRRLWSQRPLRSSPR